jgi:H+-transporting ATPase
MMVLMLLTNDVLAMSLTTDRASPASSPSVWRMRNITATAIILGSCKLAYSTAMLVIVKYQFGLDPSALQTFAFVTLLFGSQGLIYVLRERRHLWLSLPSKWVLASSTVDIGIVVVLALSGVFMEPLPWQFLVAVAFATTAFALLLDQIKRPVMAHFKLE